MALIDNEKLYENIEKKLELIKAAKEQPVIMKPFIKESRNSLQQSYL